MHPLLSIKRGIPAYLGLWFVLQMLLATLLVYQADMGWLEGIAITGPLCLFYAFLCLTPWYVCRTLPLQSTEPWRLVLNHLGAAILATALWVGVAETLPGAFGIDADLAGVAPQLIAIGLLLYLLSVALHYVLLALEASREAALQARDAELRALKSQINPHFLFNCLNSISALTASDPKRAREMCIRLADFLRNTLGMGERESIAWKEELELARTYLEVERVRFGQRLQFEMHIDDACQECRVPALILQPLIENAIKHGIASLVEGGAVRLDSRVNNGQLEVTVENTFDPEAPPARRHGLGLRNVRSRLETRYPGAARMRAAAEGNQFRAQMIFPCQKENQ